MTDDEKFFAWLDGELAPAEAAEMEAKVGADPQLQRLAEQHRAFGAQLRGAFDPIAAAPVPEHLRAAVCPSAEVIDFATAKRARTMPSLPQWAAMAATLALGIFVGTMVPQSGGGPVELKGGKIYAAAALNQALDTQLASAPAGDVRIGMTFRDQSGEICRSFTQPAASGLACREGDRWKLEGLFAAPEGQGSDYRMAAGMDPSLAALVDSTIAGEPFDAATEKAAKDKGWH
jgi:anti-sigma factor RsiW